MTENLAQEAYVAFVQICKGGSDDAGTYDADEAIVRRALKRLSELESAALAEPEPMGPTDEEIMGLMPQQMRDDLATAARGMAAMALGADNTRVRGAMRITLNRHAVDLARAVLARWGRPAPPAAGEVGELVSWLGVVSEQFRLAELDDEATQTDRAATLLEQLSAVQAPQPVAVSERLPGPEDCDAEGRCWLLTVEEDYPQWRLHSIQGAQPGGAMIWVPVDSSPGVMVDCFYTSHWLPAQALPIPATTPAGQEGA